MPSTVRFHRVLRCPPERLLRAFTQPQAFAKWLPPYGFTAEVHALDAKVGGKWRMSFTNFTTNQPEFFGGTYLELSEQRIRYTSVFDDANLPGEMTNTIVIKPVSCGVEVEITQEGIPDVIPAEMCYLGWQESLAQLAQLVEPEIPG